jgi:hypothetical protein
LKNQIFPNDFPDTLTAGAFCAGVEAAWPRGSATKVVDWLRKKWLCSAWNRTLDRARGWVRPGIHVHGKRENHGNEVSRLRNEPWDSYVSHSGLETWRYRGVFEEPPEARKQGKVFFNIVWTNESEFLNLRAK